LAAAREALVDVRSADPSILVELRYNQSDNFMKRNVYHSDRAFLRGDAARRLARANATLKDLGFKLKIWDAYRPLSVQREMWNLVPDDRYVANPAKGSRHNRGAAVDVTLTDINNREVEMPTFHDDFSERASAGARSTPAAERHAAILANCMIAAGFSPLATEWWHFDAPGWQDYELLDVPLSELAPPASLPKNN
ncbi:MAG: M15 family metallopeptidase, partial [Planctomycetota bacterium]